MNLEKCLNNLNWSNSVQKSFFQQLRVGVNQFVIFIQKGFDFVEFPAEVIFRELLEFLDLGLDCFPDSHDFLDVWLVLRAVIVKLENFLYLLKLPVLLREA